MILPVPRYLLSSVSEITPEWMRQGGYTAIAADLDDTLSRYRDKAPPPSAFAWIKSMREANFPVGIVSNNRKLERVAIHAEALGIPYVGAARKPKPDGLIRLASILGAEPSRMVMVGDQIFTDAAAGIRAGMASARVPPLTNGIWVFVRRLAEWPFIMMAKRNTNCYYEE